MALVLVISGLALLLVALVMFLRTSKEPGAGGATTNRRTVMILTVLGLVLALASQLPIFQG